ncbi:MAG: hypothetical protein BGP16_04935 [Sphingobium sp. 66-54]|nr:MAG: hypothetical protein BGP16_04935 [Sphingobium sp. 66-54]
MRALLPLACLALLAGCKGEPSFDDRYNAQSDLLEGQAVNIENELRNRMAVSNAVDAPPHDPVSRQ